jgi:hypothetical protein
MQFHLNYTPPAQPTTIKHHQPLLLLGSCFTENIGAKLKQLKFTVLENPNGILFNPVSIAQTVESYANGRQFEETDLFYANECWNSWAHHSRFSHPDKAVALAGINKSQQQAHTFLQAANWVLITLGSAFVYELVGQPTPLCQQAVVANVVANCHKVPTDKFNKQLLTATAVQECLTAIVAAIRRVNPVAGIIFTISPVRHLRDGFVENNRSKANLIQAVHNLVDVEQQVFYFPAYELVIDDLRDYRFYAEDMVHPNYAATQYVWEKFIAACIDQETQQLMQQLQPVLAARQHKAFHPQSAAHLKFLQVHAAKASQLMAKYPHLQLQEELTYFNGQE